MYRKNVRKGKSALSLGIDSKLNKDKTVNDQTGHMKVMSVMPLRRHDYRDMENLSETSLPSGTLNWVIDPTNVRTGSRVLQGVACAGSQPAGVTSRGVTMNVNHSLAGARSE